MRVDIWSDVVCPWCYVGKARFEKALTGFAHRDQVEVVYRSFELDPTPRPAGRRQKVLEMLSEKYGMSLADARQAEDHVAGLARAEGLGYDSQRPVGNTFDLHRVLQHAREKGVQHELLVAIYQAYFAEGREIFDIPVVTEIAAGAGLDAGTVGNILENSDLYADAVKRDEQEAGQLGITGVPFFVFDMALGVSGAQATDTFTHALTQAWDRTAA
ncbi:MAG TPA: DsbA family oxidoreductase [Trebonia sp.]|jgi:predicted DsbA family dithiol-disulfide isomerase|nr:DsbA family oxidoreductase [Trebonia sp.]